MAKPDNDVIARIFDDAAESYDQCSNLYAMKRRADALAPTSNGRCMEFGGGTGAVTAGLVGQSKVIHSDISPNMCRIAKNRLGCASLCLDAEAIPLTAESVDTAISSEMIYYLDHPERFLAEAHRVLRTGGKLLISTTNPAATIIERTRTLLRRLGLKRMFFDDGAPRFIPLKRLVKMLEKSGFVVEYTTKIVLLPFASLDWLNRLLELTLLRHFALFMIVVARKTQAPTS
ncbi:MAG: methyltransferase domain-containing protein [Phycisphaerales bacterium]|nr:MAG: methyltransferase domain-containing protein [Phycisphaerales bacterium]